jgi:hypothetical protein
MVRERCPELLRSSGANHLALRSVEGVFLAFIVFEVLSRTEEDAARFCLGGIARA